jgi:hypothetical protein
MAESDTGEVWDALTVEQRREPIRSLLDIVVMPATVPGGTAFNADDVEVGWRA